MNYLTFNPQKELSDFVKCYWTLESPAEEHPQKQSVVPDGCMEMIFHYGDLYRQFTSSSQSILQPRCFVIGQLTAPLEIIPTGRTGIFSVRFHPGGFIPFSTLALKDLENKAVSLHQMFSSEGKELEAAVLSAKNTAERISIVETFLIGKLSSDETLDRVVRSTVEIILSSGGQLSVDELSEQTKIHRRQLERKFAAEIGLSPKQLSKTVRLHAAFAMLVNNPDAKLAELAHEGEYYDQAHFIKDFKEMTGLTPKEFYGNNLKMSALFSERDQAT